MKTKIIHEFGLFFLNNFYFFGFVFDKILLFKFLKEKLLPTILQQQQQQKTYENEKIKHQYMKYDLVYLKTHTMDYKQIKWYAFYLFYQSRRNSKPFLMNF